jgi:hypothetical protein
MFPMTSDLGLECGQYRVCFRWTEEGAEEVEIVDYH